MDPTLTRSEAHVVFGELYRKPRSAEMQQKVDQIVSETSDVFVRIKRIEELDEGQARKDREERGQPDRRAAPRGKTPAKAPSAKKAAGKSGGGIFGKIFGGEIGRWGAETGTIATGFLGLNYKIADRVEQVFKMEEDQIIAAINCFRYAVIKGWETWDALTYNTVIAAYQFLNEFVKVPALFRTGVNPDQWINQTFKMQKYYGTLLIFPGYKKTLLEELPVLAKTHSDFSGYVPKLQQAVNFILGLDNRTPSLKNAVLAHYTITRRRIETWDNVMKELNVNRPETTHYRAPESVMQKINVRIASLKEKYSQAQDRISDVKDIREHYFDFDANGKIRVDFVDKLVQETVTHMYPRNQITDSLIKSHKTEAPRLLYTILRDFDIVCSNVLSGTVTVRAGGPNPEEQMIFRQTLFRRHIDEINAITRDLENFIKKNSSFSYSFKDFMNDTRRDTTDAIAQVFHGLVKRANHIFLEIADNLRAVLQNHDMAVDAESRGKLPEGVARTKMLAIENMEIGQRFIPFGDKPIMTSTRLNEMRVADALRAMARFFYNFLYIFRDAKLAKKIQAVPKFQAEMNSWREELLRMGVEVAAVEE